MPQTWRFHALAFIHSILAKYSKSQDVSPLRTIFYKFYSHNLAISEKKTETKNILHRTTPRRPSRNPNTRRLNGWPSINYKADFFPRLNVGMREIYVRDNSLGQALCGVFICRSGEEIN